MANKPTKKLKHKNLKQSHKNLLINSKGQGKVEGGVQRTDRKKRKQIATILITALMKMF